MHGFSHSVANIAHSKQQNYCFFYWTLRISFAVLSF